MDENSLKRFWSKVNKNGPVRLAELGPCWVWTAKCHGFGYGSFRLGKRMVSAHKVAYSLVHGDIPKGMCVLHRCDNPPCVNEAHLFLGTHADNAADRSAKGRWHGGVGENQGLAKLTDERVRRIRLDYATGKYSQTALGLQHGVSQVTVSMIVRRVIWAHV